MGRFYYSLSIGINILICFCALAGVTVSDNFKNIEKGCSWYCFNDYD